jgi:hypothetical protein
MKSRNWQRKIGARERQSRLGYGLMKRLNGEGTSESWVTLRRRKITRLSN